MGKNILTKLEEVYIHLKNCPTKTGAETNADLMEFVKEAADMIDQVNAEISPTLRQCKPDGGTIPDE